MTERPVTARHDVTTVPAITCRQCRRIENVVNRMIPRDRWTLQTVRCLRGMPVDSLDAVHHCLLAFEAGETP